ncbi:hypothetical protein HPB51_023155 [Rhipicephalus microplus]|uniref:PiggyBac transposable element-derived protein domain-containing protein n=1 Tax=Rhipicephalus microplus TaxID=6941 RepID=A0A9J6DJ61_RHIMP|nr:hypothetical protein HPB51_023155 [Rhipicephalus microplus]
MRIADGNTSDISLSDDEEGDQQPTQTDNQPDVAAGPSSPVDENDNNDGESTAKTRVSWTAKDFVRPDTTFQCEYDDPVAVAEPIEYFLKYISEEVFEEMARCTNIYVMETTGTILATTPDEIKRFLGVLIIMGTLKFPRTRMYWQPATQIPTICEAMSVNRFCKVRSALHVTESTTPHSPADKFWKVRPLRNAVKERVLQLPPSEHYSIDEQIIPFTSRVAAKQFIRNKLNQEGVKVFLRCSAEGMAHDFELYQGKGTGLLQELKSIGIWAVGTIRANRLQGCVLKTDKELRREGKGSYDQKVTKDGDVILVRWQDNGVVNVASSYVGVDDLSTARSVDQWIEYANCPRLKDLPSKQLDRVRLCALHFTPFMFLRPGPTARGILKRLKKCAVPTVPVYDPELRPFVPPKFYKGPVEEEGAPLPSASTIPYTIPLSLLPPLSSLCIDASSHSASPASPAALASPPSPSAPPSPSVPVSPEAPPSRAAPLSPSTTSSTRLKQRTEELTDPLQALSQQLSTDPGEDQGK